MKKRPPFWMAHPIDWTDLVVRSYKHLRTKHGLSRIQALRHAIPFTNNM